MTILEWVSVLSLPLSAAGFVVIFFTFRHTLTRDDTQATTAARIAEREAALKPLVDKLEHLDECMDDLKKTVELGQNKAENFRSEVRLEFSSGRAQVTGLQVESLRTFLTKEEADKRDAQLRTEINLSGRMAALEKRTL